MDSGVLHCGVKKEKFLACAMPVLAASSAFMCAAPLVAHQCIVTYSGVDVLIRLNTQ